MKTSFIISLNLTGMTGLSLLEMIRPGAVTGAVGGGWVWLVTVILTAAALIKRPNQPNSS